MKFTVNSLALKKAHMAVSKAVDAKPAMPVLENILFSPISDEQIRLIATDGINTISVVLPVSDSADLEQILVPAKFLTKFVASIGVSDIVIEYNSQNNELTLVDETVKGKFNIICDGNALEFPTTQELKDEVSFEVSASVLLESTAFALSFVANDELRHIMEGVNYAIEENRLRIAASDSKSLYLDRIANLENNTADGRSVTIAKKIASCAASILDCGDGQYVKVIFNEKNVKFVQDGTIVMGQLIEGKYPRVESVIPKSNDKVVTLDRNKLCDLIKLASLCGSETTKRIKMTFGPLFYNIDAEDIDLGKNSTVGGEVVEAKGVSKDFAICFNSDTIRSIAGMFKGSSNICFMMSQSNRAAIIKASEDADRLTLTMPMQMV